MNAALEKMLNEFEVSRLYGVVEIHYSNGIAAHLNVKKTYKLQNVDRPRGENRGTINGENQQNERR